MEFIPIDYLVIVAPYYYSPKDGLNSRRTG